MSDKELRLVLKYLALLLAFVPLCAALLYIFGGEVSWSTAFFIGWCAVVGAAVGDRHRTRMKERNLETP